MAEKLTDEELSAIIRRAISNSEHTVDGKLAAERIQVDKYYRGQLPAPLHKGDSKYVSRDVFEAVDSMRATVLEAFTANSRIVFFRPEKGETVEGAAQATDYCRHVFFKENPGEDLMYDAMTDALTKRFAVVKVYYEEIAEEETYEFENLTAEELFYQVEPYESFEFTEAEITDEGLHSGTFTVPMNTRKICVENIQPEDFLVSSRTADLQDAKYAIHRVTKSKSDLLKEGYSKKKIDKIQFSGMRDVDSEYEKQLRFEIADDIISTDEGYQEAVMEAIVHEVYIRLDMDGTDKEKLYKIVYCGGEILDKEQVSRMPFASFVPLPIPHTYLGENFGEQVIPVQNARTVLIRQIINHSLTTNNPRQMVLNGTVQNPNELLENRVGGIVNVKRMDGIAPIPQAALNPFVFNLIQMIDADKEETTGISSLSQGMNKDAISTQNAQGMVEQLISASQQRQKVIARRFGKFIRDIYFLIYHTAVDYMEEADFIAATGEYVPVNPTEWQNRSAASIELTLGYGEQEKEAQKWVELDQYFSQDPMLAEAYDYTRRYEVITRALEKRGIEDIRTLLIPPDEMKPQAPSEMEKMQMEQMKTQIEYQKAQATAMIAKAESDRMRAEAELIKVKAEAQKKGFDLDLEERKFAHEKWVDTEELELARKVPEAGQRAVLAPN